MSVLHLCAFLFLNNKYVAVKEFDIPLLLCFTWFSTQISWVSVRKTSAFWKEERACECAYKNMIFTIKVLLKKYLNALTCCWSVHNSSCNGLICWMFPEQGCRLKRWRVLFRFQEETRRGETHWQCLSDVTLCHSHVFMQRNRCKETGCANVYTRISYKSWQSMMSQ